MPILTSYAAAQIAGVDHDDAMVLQTAHTRLLAAAARGEIDLNDLARTELVARGLGPDGRWVGFDAAAAAHGL